MYSSKPDPFEQFSDAPPTTSAEAATSSFLGSSSSQSHEPSHRAAFAIQTKVRDPWSTGLFGCFSDVKNCCKTCWCPCITFGQIAEIVDKGSSSCGANGALYTLICCVVCCPCFYSCFYRTKMRQQYLLRERPCGDCLVHCCCEPCALCQEYRELEGRGFDMSIGWQGNVERRNREAIIGSTAPLVERGMSR